MCNYSAKLIAWLDHELPENEASDLEQHVQGCSECRSLASTYETTSDLFHGYCEVGTAKQDAGVDAGCRGRGSDCGRAVNSLCLLACAARTDSGAVANSRSSTGHRS